MTKCRTFKLIWLISLLACYLIPSAQVPNNVNVNDLSDQQVQQIVDEITDRGLTMEQAIDLARVRGASPTQISQLQAASANCGMQGKPPLVKLYNNRIRPFYKQTPFHKKQ